MNVLVAGATGFVGRHLVSDLVDEGHLVRCLVRESSDRSVLPEDAVEFAVADVTRPQGFVEACEGCDAVVHLVGIIVEAGDATFERVHVIGTRNIVEAAKQTRVEQFVYLSGLGAAPRAPGRYGRTKWQAEEIVKQSGIQWTIIRSSVIVGDGAGFVESILGLLHKGPFIPIVGDGQTRFQPIYVEDLCQCIAWCLAHPDSAARTYEVGGPEWLTFEEMVDEVARLRGVRKRKVHVPVGVVRIIALLQERFSRRPEITRDQLKMMEVDNVCDPDVLVKAFGFAGTPYRQALATFFTTRR